MSWLFDDPFYFELNDDSSYSNDDDWDEVMNVL